ncbi:MAG: PucR family transcriptional regulator [Candidatus Leucobacter sulfamidivorax]|nr:PucR family transcriptional regulator [Candidatus Leucobacter sulfamidivorax]
MFDALLNGRYRSDTELAAQLAAAGLPIEGSPSPRPCAARVVRACTLHWSDPRDRTAAGGHPRAGCSWPSTSPRGRPIPATPPLRRRLLPADGPVLLALVSLPAGDARIPSAADRGAPALAGLLARELDMLVPEPTPPGWRAHLALGRPARRLRGLVTALEQLRAAGRLHAVAEVGRVAVQLAEGQPLAHLVRGLSALPELQEFALDTLGPVIEHDRAAGPAHPGDLLRVLEAYVAHPTNRSLAAQRAKLSRSVFYQRLALIEDLLGVDLADGETTAAIAVALLVRPA